MSATTRLWWGLAVLAALATLVAVFTLERWEAIILGTITMIATVQYCWCADGRPADLRRKGTNR